jgi:V/A-type H+-transporting ATPase subunit K
MIFVLVSSMILVLSVIFLGLVSIKRGINCKNIRIFMGLNVLFLFGLLTAAAIMMYTGNVSATNEGVQTVAAAKDGLQYIAAALSTGLATIGAGIAVAVASSAALGAISEDSKLLGKTLIFVGLAEGIAIYGLIVSILILYGN